MKDAFDIILPKVMLAACCLESDFFHLDFR